MSLISVCESCNRGYGRGLHDCPWCGAGNWLSFTEHRIVRMLDTECYPNYWLCKLTDFESGEIHEFELYPEGPAMDRLALTQLLSRSTIVTFNGKHYDEPMIALALAGATNAQLKQANDEIIVGRLRPWEFLERWKLNELDWLDHIDLIEVAPGQTSLKEYGGKMHSKKMQDLPIEPHEFITHEQRPILREYCGNDLATTYDLYKTFRTQIKLREEISAEYGIDVRSKSDPQIAEAVFKTVIGRKLYRPEIPVGMQFHYQPQHWIKFQDLNLIELLARSPFTISNKHGIEQTDELAKYHIRIGRTTYHMGVGGLHSTEKGAVHVADDIYSLQDVDVASYYPKLILQTKIVPSAIGQQFLQIYEQWYNTRLAAKRGGDKKKADSLKTFLNGTFGKLNSMWSIFYDPQGFVQVTIGGQLSILMLIESLETCGISVVSANTDGIVIKCRRDLEWLRDECIRYWCEITGFETEAVNYRAIMSRDVNNYMAITTDGKVKLKGAYARPVPVATSWPNPSGEICIDALVEYFTKGTPLETTIRACTDVRKFVNIRRVKGGGMWKGHFLGKAVRWYYATGDTDEILYRVNGNKVPTSEGSRPLMELPDVLPLDVDYARYLADARGMLADLGVQG